MTFETDVLLYLMLLQNIQVRKFVPLTLLKQLRHAIFHNTSLGPYRTSMTGVFAINIFAMSFIIGV